MDEQTRRAWSRPELIVIVRSGPEEVVLTKCRYAGAGGDVPSTQNNGCWTGVLGCTACSGVLGAS